MAEISAVIPTLGRPTLERAVASVATQTLQPALIVIVDNGRDGVSDSRRSHLQDIAGDVPIVILSLPPFSGPSICRNFGAWQARSEFVAFLDDDDEFAPDYLEVVRRRIAADDPDVLYGAKVWRDDDGSVRREKRLSTVPADRWLETLYRHENPGFGGQNVVVRRRVLFELAGFPVDLPSGEDRAFAMTALRAGRQVAYVDEAEVWCHDPEGYRAKARPDKWVTNLKIMREFWSDASWGSRVVSGLRWTRSLLRR